MPTPLVVLFYIWLVVSIGVLIYRRVGRSATKAPKAREPRPARDVTFPPPPGAQAADEAEAPTPAGGMPRAATSMMEALAGIQLPCDLVPLNYVAGLAITERELTLVTSGHPADEIGTALGDELERLGYELLTMAPHEALATRGADRVRITIHARPDTVLTGKTPTYPTAPAGSVVVELSL